MEKSTLINKSKEFSVNLIKFVDESHINYALSSQLIRSGTSIGANIHEAHYAQSKPDFISKLEIALKECYETEYWLEILNKSLKLKDEFYSILISKAQELRRILIKSCTTAKNKQQK